LNKEGLENHLLGYYRIPTNIGAEDTVTIDSVIMEETAQSKIPTPPLGISMIESELQE